MCEKSKTTIKTIISTSHVLEDSSQALSKTHVVWKQERYKKLIKFSNKTVFGLTLLKGKGNILGYR